MVSKRGQVTIYIIVGVVVIVGVILFLLFRSGIIPNPINPSSEVNPNSFLKECMQDKVTETVKLMEPQGGTLNPTLYKKFMFVEEGKAYNVSYLCYNQNDYLPCVNQRPMLISSMEEEIKNEIRDTVEECFDDLESSYKNAGYDVSVSGSEYDVSLHEGEVVVKLDRTIEMTKGDQSSVLKDFRVAVPSKIYDLAFVSVEIVNEEAMNCVFDYVAFMKFYPKYKVDKQITTDYTEIYTITNRDSGEWFRFAVRGCAIPATY